MIPPSKPDGPAPSNGFLHRCTVDPSTGQIADQRTRLCGAKACKLIKVKAQVSAPFPLPASEG